MASRLLFADSPRNIQFVALAARRFSAQQTHAAIFYRTKDGELYRLEVTGKQHNLQRNPCNDTFCWVVPNLKREELVLLAELCDLIWEKDRSANEIPYGIEYSYETVFNPLTGKLKIGDKLRGLTCATFLLAVFNSFGIQILALDTWPYRPEDEQWQEQIAEAIPIVKGEKIPCLRYRPEEVVGAWTANAPLPIEFEIAEARGRTLLAELDEYLRRSGKTV